jgi:hypothetical protein
MWFLRLAWSVHKTWQRFWYRRVAVHDSAKKQIKTHSDNYDTNAKTG